MKTRTKILTVGIIFTSIIFGTYQSIMYQCGTVPVFMETPRNPTLWKCLDLWKHQSHQQILPYVPEPEPNPILEGTYVDRNTYVYSVNEAEFYLNYTLGTPYLPEGTELEKIKISSDKRKSTLYYSNGLEVKHNPMGINFNNTHYKLNPEREEGIVFYDFRGTFAKGYEIDEPNRPHYSTIIIHRDDRIYVRATMDTGLDELLKMIEPMDLNVQHVPYTPTLDYVMGAPEPQPIPEQEPENEN